MQHSQTRVPGGPAVRVSARDDKTQPFTRKRQETVSGLASILPVRGRASPGEDC